MTEKKLYGSVLLKAAEILDALAKKGGQTIQLLSKETGISPSNLSKILETLMHIGYVIRDQNKLYYLGSKFMKYHTQNIEAQRLLAVARPYLEELRESVDETIHLSVLENDKMVYIDKLEPQNKGIYMTSQVGLARSLYSSGMGKAVLSSFSEEQLTDYLAKTELVPLAKNTITTSEALRRDLVAIRERGYAIDDEEQENDGYCIAVKLEANDRVIGAMSVSFPKFRYTPAFEEEVVAKIQKTKTAIEHCLQSESV